MQVAGSRRARARTRRRAARSARRHAARRRPVRTAATAVLVLRQLIPGPQPQEAAVSMPKLGHLKLPGDELEAREL